MTEEEEEEAAAELKLGGSGESGGKLEGHVVLGDI